MYIGFGRWNTARIARYRKTRFAKSSKIFTGTIIAHFSLPHILFIDLPTNLKFGVPIYKTPQKHLNSQTSRLYSLYFIRYVKSKFGSFDILWPIVTCTFSSSANLTVWKVAYELQVKKYMKSEKCFIINKLSMKRIVEFIELNGAHRQIL